MTSSFRERLEEIRRIPKMWKNGERVYQRDDDVYLAVAIAETLNTTEHPAIYDDGSFWSYDDASGTWVALPDTEVERACMGLSGCRVFHKLVKKTDDQGNQYDEIETRSIHMSGAKVSSVCGLVKTILSETGSFDAPMRGLAFRNGFAVPQPEGVRLRPKSPSNRARTAIDFAWRDYPCPKWHNFLDGVFLGDADKEQKKLFLQEFVGLALVGGSVYQEQAAILVGGGSNGKSVFLDIVQKVFPSRNIAAIPPQLWDNEYYRARLDGVALNIVSELPPKEILDSNAVKAVISGEEIEARRPRENPFRFRPKAAHLFSINPPMPPAADLSRGFWRRWVAVTFNRSFENDPQKLEKRAHVADLMTEHRGIITWAMHGAARFAKQGSYTVVPSSAAFLEEWRCQSDQVALFVRSSCWKPTEVKQMATSEELYRAYRSWGERTGHRMLVSLSRFCERLTLLGHHERQDGAQQVRPLAVAIRREASSEAEDPPAVPAPPATQVRLFSGVPGPRRRGPESDPEPS